MKPNQLVQTAATDGIYLHGYYVPAANKKTAVLLVHGLEGNFYELNFVYTLADKFEEKGIGFLTANNRGNGKDTDFKTVDGKLRRIGSRFELLEEAHLDITAWLKFLVDEGYSEIILMGHSAGAVKAVRYLFEGELQDRINKLVLLAPIDPLGMRIAKGRVKIEDFLKQARAKVNEGKGEELVTSDFDHDILSYQTFISWYRRDELGRCFEFCAQDYDFPVLKKIHVPVKIIVGSEDKYFHPTDTSQPQKALAILLKNIPHAQGKIIAGAGHCFEGYEQEFIKGVDQFL